MTIFFSVVVLISSLSLIVSVVMQEGSESGLGAIGGGSEPLFGKSRGTSREDMLKRITVISAVIFIISTLVLAAK
ncbi:preprotein translocase subunit SecG [Tissierella pigra]|uniref:Protein-export membrane protein SecG n=1 Tax=Tissierella pigra TaxID=2607614 RepID=A0A6N7XF70_9FIRM|nr:preprotein translocase subunit SecG [Tissierella pigra]MBU5425925.1 preprotein translocase subunit SecG [Tissierella pigra]MSU00711.1 preprotein translocase subunit SecG [Tissierella pigra]